ncbi:hypothetical protein QCA50_008341 [Cerrena zonata]|uniref:Uncharacterized protein n=1 Tax=Cerrena zonata TaxID=2478898 RepID=A0AAW0GH73_9APHY
MKPFDACLLAQFVLGLREQAEMVTDAMRTASFRQFVWRLGSESADQTDEKQKENDILQWRAKLESSDEENPPLSSEPTQERNLEGYDQTDPISLQGSGRCVALMIYVTSLHFVVLPSRFPASIIMQRYPFHQISVF